MINILDLPFRLINFLTMSLNPLLIGAGLGALGGLFGGGGSTEQIGSYGSLDPEGYTSGTYDQLMNQYNLASQGFTGAAGNMAFNPGASFDLFMGQAPALQGLAQGATSDLEASLREQTGRFQRDAIQNVASEFSGLGALYSGAARDTAARRSAEIGAEASNILGAQQIGLTGQLLGQGFQSANQNIMQQLQNQQMQFSTYANLLGQTGSTLGAFGAPTYTAPTTVQGGGTFQNIMQGGMLGATLGGAIGG